MISIRRLPIRKKIILITMITSATALLLAGTTFFLYDRIESRRELENYVKTLAAITADNVMSAVSFGDAKVATDTLNALQSDPLIVAGCVYSSTNLLAQYARTNGDSCPGQPGEDGLYFESGHVYTVQPIRINGGKRIGSLRLRGTLEPLSARMTRDVFNIGLVMLVAAVFAFALSSWLQRWISGPLLALTRTTRSISESDDYSIRASKHTDDELGNLVDSVNEMLSEIQLRHAEREQTMRDRERLLLREQELRKQAEETSRLKDEFLATLSHELRTPLTSIVGWAAMLRSGQLPEEKTRTGLEALDRNARAQARLIDDLLDVSGITSGKLGLQWSSIDIQQLIKSAVESIRPLADSKRITVTVNDLGPDGRIDCDTGRLLQAIGNVLSNAVKFTNKDGRIFIDLNDHAGQVRITIRDTGMGIAPDFLPYVFDRFRQADGSSTRNFGGLGLGLSIARHIITMHGGTIQAFSAGLNQGTTFTIEIPRQTSLRQSG